MSILNGEWYRQSLAGSTMRNGAKKEAISSYNKSLELNPENENAKQMLIKCQNM